MGNLHARPVRTEDAAAIAAIYGPYVTDSVVSFEIEPPSLADMQRRITEIGAKYPWLVAQDGERIAGYVYASQHSARAAYGWSADVTAYLHADYHRQGLGTRLYRILFGLLRRQGFRSLYAGITLPNAASIALHRRMGMSEVGVYRNVGFKFGAWRDVAWLGFSFPDERPPAGPPQRFDALTVNAAELEL
jgi:phosphinothricin acetyltransferase